jgi:hypothetical protein
MSEVYGYYSGNEITVHFTATAYENDYGVRGSPVWLEYEDFRIDSLEILGVDVNPDTLPGPLVAAILELVDEVEFCEVDFG